MISKKENLNFKTKIALSLTLAVLGLGAACSPTEPTSLPTQTAVPTPVSTATMTAFERNCNDIPKSTSMIALASTLLGSLYVQKITPGQVELCIPVIAAVNKNGTNYYETRALISKKIDGKIPENTTICYGTDLTAVLADCSSITP